MKTRRFILTTTLMAILMATSMSATAEERGSVQTPVTGTTISGYVDTTVIGRASAERERSSLSARLWWRFLYRMGVRSL
jgi:hypothetical protein